VAPAPPRLDSTVPGVTGAAWPPAPGWSLVEAPAVDTGTVGRSLARSAGGSPGTVGLELTDSPDPEFETTDLVDSSPDEDAREDLRARSTTSAGGGSDL
jgi:hypothetical protein